MAVQRMTPSKLAMIREAHERHRMMSSIEDLVSCDFEFHSAIVRAAENDTLFSILDCLSSQTVRLRIWGGIVSDNAVGLTIDHHGNILRAIEAGDSHGAEAASLVHVTAAKGWLDAYLDSHPSHAAQVRSVGRPAATTV
ncbi:FadR/GntR family transcriptional regulator [Microbacterium sp. Au-Mic1]|uniref:FadR/GntR family transcriptional regulator n=1 Tax=Microbacterium sp. Au-Mic1 TaxID=2906457 RepID=UPI0022795E44|nr:FCD domain-containing protein [Microbacterium sp. Au-Mic1]